MFRRLKWRPAHAIVARFEPGCRPVHANGPREAPIQALDEFRNYISGEPLTLALASLTGLVLLAWFSNWIAKKLAVRPVDLMIARTPLRHEANDVRQLVTHLANVVPAVVLHQGIPVIAGLPDRLVVFVQVTAQAFIIFTLARALCDLLDLGNDAYQLKPDAASRPIKGYVQVAKIVVYAAAVILIVAALIGQSPLLLLSGLGALAAVLMLIFRDTILSLVASVQLRSNDMLRVGDWIEMPQLNADGDVIDIALHTVKVQNFDKTVTTVPTHKLISEPYRNWRFVREWGGRRIMRALLIDQRTIGFLDREAWEGLRCFALLEPYMAAKDRELAEWNGKHDSREGVNRRRPTNVGTFRAYVIAYLQAHPRIAGDGTLLVRQLAPNEKGLPLEIYCFTDTVDWSEYEGIQADIFDHLLAILPRFGLRLFQQPGGADLAAMSETLSPHLLQDAGRRKAGARAGG
jgi:miniconductance mechanosensitive channel